MSSPAKKVMLFMGPKEWGNELMEKLAKEVFDNREFDLADCVEVHEHAGWFLTFNRDMVVVGTANDGAHLCPEAIRWWNRHGGQDEIIGIIRRNEEGVQTTMFPPEKEAARH